MIAGWSYGLVRDTGAILLDMTPDSGMAARVRAAIENDGDTVTALHYGVSAPGIRAPSFPWARDRIAMWPITEPGYRGSARCRI